jgi:hypothetical protein
MKLTKKLLKEMVKKELGEAFGDGGSFGAPSGAPGVSREGKLINALSNCQKNPEDPGCPKNRDEFKRLMAADAERAKKTEEGIKQMRIAYSKKIADLAAKRAKQNYDKQMQNKIEGSGFGRAVRQLQAHLDGINRLLNSFEENKQAAIKAMMSGNLKDPENPEARFTPMDKETANMVFDNVYLPRIQNLQEAGLFDKLKVSLNTNAGAYLKGMVPTSVKLGGKMPNDMEELLEEFAMIKGEIEKSGIGNLMGDKGMGQTIKAAVALHQQAVEMEKGKQPEKKGLMGKVKSFFGFKESINLSSEELGQIVEQELNAVIREKK